MINQLQGKGCLELEDDQGRKEQPWRDDDLLEMWEVSGKKDVLEEEVSLVPDSGKRSSNDDEELQLTAVPSVGILTYSGPDGETDNKVLGTVEHFTDYEHPGQLWDPVNEDIPAGQAEHTHSSMGVQLASEADIHANLHTADSVSRGLSPRLEKKVVEIKTTPPRAQKLPQQPETELSQAGAAVSVGVDSATQPSQPGVVRKLKGGQCQHTRGGFCLLHGKAGKKMMKPVVKRVTGPGGEIVVKKSKRTWYLCEDGGSGGKDGMKQTQLCFTPGKPTQPSDESVGGGEGVSTLGYTDFSSSTAGQHGMYSTNTAGQE